MLTVAAGEKSAAVAAAPSKPLRQRRTKAPRRARQRRQSVARQGRPAAGQRSLAAAEQQSHAGAARRKAGEPGMATPMMILEAINRLGLYSPEVKTALEAAREAPDADVRAAAYKAREQAIAAESAADRSASAIAAAGLALKDQDGTVRCAGIGLLSAADPKEALALLLPAVKDPDPDVRAAALAALPEIADDPDIAAAIKDALSDPSPDVVRAAAVAAARRPALGADVQAALSQAVGPLTLHSDGPQPGGANRRHTRPGQAEGRRRDQFAPKRADRQGSPGRPGGRPRAQRERSARCRQGHARCARPRQGSRSG